MSNQKSFLMKSITRTKIKVLMIMFFATGIVGMTVGLTIGPAFGQSVMITFMGVINFGLGAFFTYLFLTRKPELPDKRKKKRKND